MNKEQKKVLAIIVTLLESPPNRFGKLEFYSEDARNAVRELQGLAVKYQIGGCATVLQQAAKVARAVLS